MPIIIKPPTFMRCGLPIRVMVLAALALAACTGAEREGTTDARVDAGPSVADGAMFDEEDSQAPDAADQQQSDGGEDLDAGPQELDGDLHERDGSVAGDDASESDAGDAGDADVGDSGEPKLAFQLGAADAVTRPAQAVASESGDLFIVGATNGSIGDAVRRGVMDALIMRIGPDGRLVWTRQLGDVGIAPGLVVKAWDVALTRDGLVVVGLVNGRPSFQGMPLTSTFSGFVAAFGEDGEQRWLRVLAGHDGATEAMGVEVLEDESIVVVGYTTATTLLEANARGAGDVFLSWLSPQGEVLKTRRYGGADEEYPTAVTRRAGSIYLAYKTLSAQGSSKRLELARIGALGDVEDSLLLDDPARQEIAALAPTDQGICAAFQLRTYSEEAGHGSDYGLRCYGERLNELRSFRGGAPGAQLLAQSIACERDGACVLAGVVDTFFEGEPVAVNLAAFAIGIRPDGTRLFAQRFEGKVAEGSLSSTRATSVVSAGQGRFVLVGETNAELLEAQIGRLDTFAVSIP